MSATCIFKVLDGLPPYGPPPQQFTAGSKRTHTEGLVLEIEPPGGKISAQPIRGRFEQWLESA